MREGEAPTNTLLSKSPALLALSPHPSTITPFVPLLLLLLLLLPLLLLPPPPLPREEE